MNKSKRHHYLPQYFIKRFGDENEKIWVYDKKYKNMSSKQKSAKYIFFEWHRNTFEVAEETMFDGMEKVYADIDTLFSTSLSKLLDENDFSPEVFIDLVMFYNTLRWRIPSVDSKFDELKHKMSLDDLGVKIKFIGKGDDEQEMRDHLSEAEIVKESKRIMLPFMPFYDEKVLKKLYTHCNIQLNKRSTNLLADIPFIQREETTVHSIDDFILPLSKETTLVFKNGTKGRLQNELFFLNQDLATFHNAIRFVACSDKKHLENIVKLSTDTLDGNEVGAMANKMAFNFIS